MPPLEIPEYRVTRNLFLICGCLATTAWVELIALNLCKFACKTGSTTVTVMAHWGGIPVWRKPAGENHSCLHLASPSPKCVPCLFPSLSFFSLHPSHLVPLVASGLEISPLSQTHTGWKEGNRKVSLFSSPKLSGDLENHCSLQGN